MLRWVILSAVVVVLAATATLVVAFVPDPKASWNLPARVKREGPTPKVELDGVLTHDFNTMSQQATGNHSWKVKNVGQADLELWMQSSTCMCTIAKLAKGSRAVVKPGESTDIELEWKTNNTSGDFTKGATIGTNDPDRPSFQLGVHGMVHPPIVVLPSNDLIQLGTISNDESKSSFVAIFSPDRKDMKLTKITSSKPEFLVVKQEELKPEDRKQLKVQGGYRLTIEARPGMSLGTLREEIVINTDHPQQPKLELIVVGNVSGPISVVPDRLRMINVKGKEGASGEVSLIVRGATETKFEVARKPASLQVSILQDDKAAKGRYRMQVSVPPGTPAGLLDEEIILKTNHPKAGELKIPISILVGAG